MKTVGLGVSLTLALVLMGPGRLSLRDGFPSAVFAQRKLPELLYTCPMHPEVLEAKEGSCPVCKMRLEPVRIEEDLWYSCPIHAATLGPSSGVCPLDKRQKMPVVVTVHWICEQSPDQKLMEPGRCADGRARKEIHQIRAHGDHNPRHGGQFYMAADSWHHVEGTYPQPDLFRLYFYDNFTQPIDVKPFAARIVGDGRADVALKAARGNTMEARVGDATMPLRLTLKVRFASDAPESQFDFTFNELSKDPVVSPVPTPTASAPKAPASTTTGAPSSLVAAAPPTQPVLTNCEPNVSRTDVLLMSDSLPKDARSLLDLLRMCRTEVQKLIDSGQYGFVYQPTMLGKEIALALETHINTLPERRHAEVSDNIRRVVLSAWQLDLFGDLGDQSKLADAYRLFAAAVDDIGLAYGSQR